MDITGDRWLAGKLLLEPLMRYQKIDEFPVATAYAWASAYSQSAIRQVSPDLQADRCRTCDSRNILTSPDGQAWNCLACGAHGTCRPVRLIIRDRASTSYEIETVHGALNQDGDIVITINIR